MGVREETQKTVTKGQMNGNSQIVGRNLENTKKKKKNL